MDAPETNQPADDVLQAVICLLAVGLRRALTRPHIWNESVNPGDAMDGVAVDDQTGMNGGAPTSGAKETT
jgi:hypothetical protein